MRCLAGWFIILFIVNSARALDLALPTDNDALFRGDGPAFYQVVERDFQGVKSTPWEGGQYGYVRNPRVTADGLVFTRLHEGMDIRPLRRDERGEPLDEVRAIAEGKVVYTSGVAGASNYGRYVVVSHEWDGARYYSLYAHLAKITAAAGARVVKGAPLGVMGYTGAGIDQPRAHVHVELNLMLSSQFEEWHARYFPAEKNQHGLYNGLNLAGLDLAQLLLAARKDPALSVAQFVQMQPPFFKVHVSRALLDLGGFYPWLWEKPNAGAHSAIITFDRTGLPLRIEPRPESVAEPRVVWVKTGVTNLAAQTRDLLGGTAAHPRLSAAGLRWLDLLVPAK